MPNVFFYTFRTNRFVGDIEDVLGERVYVIDRYAKDFDMLMLAISKSGAEAVCGIGISRWYTRFEEMAFNKLGKNRIVKDGEEEVKLSIPKGFGIKSDSRMTFGPCNYVAYRISTESKLKNFFLHLKPDDIDLLRELSL